MPVRFFFHHTYISSVTLTSPLYAVFATKCIGMLWDFAVDNIAQGHLLHIRIYGWRYCMKNEVEFWRGGVRKKTVRNILQDLRKIVKIKCHKG